MTATNPMHCECATWARSVVVAKEQGHHPQCIVARLKTMLKHFKHVCAEGDGIPEEMRDDFIGASICAGIFYKDI